MSNETTQSEPSQPARRRIVALSERRVALPIALIAHEGAQRDEIESQISLTRPVVTFPSLAHFDADSAGRERWAGVVIARSHAWDARLDTCVPRRAFIALYGLSPDEEGYGWPEAVKRINTQGELEGWLTAVASPVLPPDDRPRVVKPRSKPSVFTMSLAGDPIPVRNQLSLPAVDTEGTGFSPAKVAPAKAAAPKAQLALPAIESAPRSSKPTVRAAKPKKLQRAYAEKATPRTPSSQTGLRAKPISPPKLKVERARPALKTSQGLRLTSNDAQEQALIDAVRLLGAASARAIVDALERFDRI